MKKVLIPFVMALGLFMQLHANDVVCIHGFLTTAYSMRFVESALKECGFTPSLFRYPSRSKTIEAHGQALVCHLQKLADQCPGAPIDFVAHSIGALILRSALNNPCCPSEARCGSAVLLAPPSQGSKLARKFAHNPLVSFILGNKAGRELTHYFPCQIACCFGEFPASMRVLVIAGSKGSEILFNKPNDGFLAVDETFLNTAYYFKCCPMTHGELLYKPEAIETITNFISSK